MATQTVIVWAHKSDRFDSARIFSDLVELGTGELTDEHASASYSQPVLIYNGRAYGAGDMPRGWELSRTTADHSQYHEARCQAARNCAETPRDLLDRWLDVWAIANRQM